MPLLVPEESQGLFPELTQGHWEARTWPEPRRLTPRQREETVRSLYVLQCLSLVQPQFRSLSVSPTVISFSLLVSPSLPLLALKRGG